MTGFWAKLDDDEAIVEGRERTAKGQIDGVHIVDIACGSQHTVALADDGNVYTWGYGGKKGYFNWMYA